LKRESESFSRLLDRLAEEVASAGTGADVLRRLGHGPPALSRREGAAHVSAQRLKEGLEGISRFDAWIAAWARQHGAPVLTGNPRHFRKFPGVKVLELAV
jgi:predicted nucleic acid-binding protein